MIALSVLLFLALGAVAGMAHFAALAGDAAMLVHGGSAMRAIALRLGRFLLTTVVLLLAALHGWISLLAATAGFMAARGLLLRRLGRLE